MLGLGLVAARLSRFSCVRVSSGQIASGYGHMLRPNCLAFHALGLRSHVAAKLSAVC